MKVKKFEKKLVLRKETVSNIELSALKGGGPITSIYECAYTAEYLCRYTVSEEVILCNRCFATDPS